METAIILIASQDSMIPEILHEKRPDLQVVCIGTVIPEIPVKTKLLCLVDWLLPDISGLEMCRLLRANPATEQAHITVILDEADNDIQRRVLRAGADDYLIRPVITDSLLERISLYIDGSSISNTAPKLSHGELVIDIDAYGVRYRNRILPLPQNEYRLLTHFVANPNKLLSRQNLIQMIGKDRELLDERTVDVWIGRLRHILISHGIPDPIRTVRSHGYVLDSVGRE